MDVPQECLSLNEENYWTGWRVHANSSSLDSDDLTATDSEGETSETTPVYILDYLEEELFNFE